MAYGDTTKDTPKSGLSVEIYRKKFDDYRSVTEDNRLRNCKATDYYHGEQLTSDEKQQLAERGQPDIVVNRLRVAINGILGVTARARSDPRCWPRTPKDEDSADVATDALRYIKQRNRFDYTRVSLFHDILVPGTAAVITIVNADRDIEFQQIRWEEFFIDPRSRREDGKDATYMGIAKWMYADDVARIYPSFKIDTIETMSTGVGGIVDESFEDRPRDAGQWLDRRNRRVMIVEMYHKYQGKWWKCVFYGGGILEEVVSPYKDEKGRPTNPIECCSAYVDRNNNRYGPAQDMIPIQDEVNKRRSKLLWLITASQIQARDPSAIEVDADTARKEAARPDGVLPFGWEKVPTTDMAQGQMQLLAESKAELERFGPNPAVLGRQGADTSGRALLARQQAGLVELAILFDRLEDLELRCYRQAWARAKQFWTFPMWLRITDDIEAPRFLGINMPKGPQMVDPQTGQPAVDSQTGKPVEGEPQFDLTGQSIFGYKNTVAEMDVDIIIDTAPETATIMQEQLKDLIDMVGSNPTYAAQVPFEVFIEMTPLPKKRELISRIREYASQQQQAQQAQAQQQMAAEMQKAMAQVRELLSKGDLNEAQALLARAEAHAVGLHAGAAVASAAHKAFTDAEKPVTGAGASRSGVSDA